MKKIKLLLLTAVATFAMFVLVGCGTTTVNLNKYMSITVTGYDSLGTATYTFDRDAFVRDYGSKIKIKDKYMDTEAKMELSFGSNAAEMMLGECVNYSLDKKADLKNGDVATIKWTCDDNIAKEKYNVKLKYTDIAHNVTELTAVEFFNPFDSVKVTFGGISPKGTYEISPDYSNPRMQYIRFNRADSTAIANGSDFVVKAELSISAEEYVNKFNCLPEIKEKSYKVENLAHYITDFSEIPNDKKEAMRKAIEDEIEINKSFPLNAFELENMYLLSAKQGKYSPQNNILYFVYKLNRDLPTGEKIDYIWYGYFNNVYVDSDGNFCCSTKDAGVAHADKWFKSGDYLEVGNGKYYVTGKKDIASFEKDYINSKIETYEYKKLNN